MLEVIKKNKNSDVSTTNVSQLKSVEQETNIIQYRIDQILHTDQIIYFKDKVYTLLEIDQLSKKLDLDVIYLKQKNPDTQLVILCKEDKFLFESKKELRFKKKQSRNQSKLSLGSIIQIKSINISENDLNRLISQTIERLQNRETVTVKIQAVHARKINEFTKLKEKEIVQKFTTEIDNLMSNFKLKIVVDTTEESNEKGQRNIKLKCRVK